jgi:hypothetical protein
MILNPFAADAFSLQSLVAAINILPNNYGKINQMGLFPIQGVRSRTIIVEKKYGVLNLLPTLPVGSPGTKATKGYRDVRSFVIPHIPHDDTILPQEYDGIRAFGSENQTETLARIMNDHLQTMRDKHAITLEYQRMGALKGVVLDADGSTIYDYFSEFTVKKKEVDFLLGTSTTNIKAKCKEVSRWIEEHLQGETMSRIHVLVDKDFWDAFVEHAVVKTAYERWRDGLAFREDLRSQGFYFCGLNFEEYEGTATDKDGVERKFLTSKDGIAFPLGTRNTFKTYVCPADFMETVNTTGKLLYAKQEPRKFNRGIDIHTQSNPLSICQRPSLIVRVYSSN